MTGRIVNRTTPGLRKPTPIGAVDIAIAADIAAYMRVLQDAFPHRGPKTPAYREMFAGQTDTYTLASLPAKVAGADFDRTPADKIVDYPGPDALDHYARGGVVRVQRDAWPGPVVRTSATARHRPDIGAWL